MDSLVGILSRDWWTLLKENHYSIDPPYWPKGLFLLIKSIYNTKLAKREKEQFSQAIEKAQIEQPPIFIVGHWRSGTTLLHNYLSLDPRFAFPSTLDVKNPHTFLIFQNILKNKKIEYKAQKRRMDNIRVTLKSPAEDEFALAIMSLKSPLLGWAFPKREQKYNRYLTFRRAEEWEKEVWKRSVAQLYKKLTLKYGGRQLLLKSPTHTGKIAILYQMFPKAKFIHIHRNPYRVFQSTLKLYQTAIKASRLQIPWQRNAVEHKIINQYLELFEAFHRDRALLPAEQFVEIAFEDLEKTPIKTIKSLYHYFDWDNFNDMRKRVEKYIDANKGYQKNRFRPLQPNMQLKVAQAWKKYFEIWHYKID